MGGRGSSSGRSSGGRTYSDKQIISDKRKISGFNTKGEFVMSKFDAGYKKVLAVSKFSELVINITNLKVITFLKTETTQ